MTPEELEEYNQAFPHEGDFDSVGDYPDDDCDWGHPGHPSNYGDN